ncbi:MAG: tripartite tricarboxylate transporter substrate binding protein [Betaproteobacteria bacterium]|nr:tripartite tricarboxylate transporter substrate binding protein [Betaproteobacteria bacterium]
MLALLRLSGVFALVVAGFVHAQSYPVKPVRLVAGFPPGGGVDATARAYAQKLGENWGQTVIVENRAGANGMIGGESVARAPRDGYTLFLSTPSEVALNPLLYAKHSYEPLKDLAPVSRVVDFPNVMVVHPSVPARTLKELIALAKKTPGGLNYGTSGIGSTQHLAGEWLKRNAGVNWAHIAYKGAAPAVTDIVGGQIPVAIVGLGAMMGQIKAGRLRAIAVTSKNRTAALPDLPTLYDAGIQFDATQWYGILATAGTPPEIIGTIEAAIRRAANDAGVKARLLGLGGDPVSSTPEEYVALIRSETAKFAKIIKDANIRYE